MKLYKFTKSYIISILFVLIIIIFSFNTLNEKIEFYIFNSSFNLGLKYLLLIILGIGGLFYFFKDREYLNNYYFLIYLILFPFLLNGIVGLMFFVKGFLSILISLLLYKWIVDEKIYELLKKISKLILSLFLICYFFAVGLSYTVSDILNHNKDLAIIVIFLTFFLFYKVDYIKNRFDFYFFLPLIVIFFYINQSKTSLILFLLIIFSSIIKKVYYKNIFLLTSFVLLIFFLFSSNSQNDYNKSENILINLDEISSLRISRALKPCKWVEYRYFKSRTYMDMQLKDKSYKNCPYDKYDQVTLLPINFLNYEYKMYSENNLEINSFKNKFKNLNEEMRSYNLDNSFAEYFYMNGIIFFVYFMIILFSIIYLLFNHSNKNNKKYLNYFLYLLIYFMFHSGLFAPGNLLAIIFNLLFYKLIYSVKDA